MFSRQRKEKNERLSHKFPGENPKGNPKRIPSGTHVTLLVQFFEGFLRNTLMVTKNCYEKVGFLMRARHRKPPGQRPTEEVDRCVPQELSLDCCLENERVLGHTGRLLVDIHLLCWGLLGAPPLETHQEIPP